MLLLITSSCGGMAPDPIGTTQTMNGAPARAATSTSSSRRGIGSGSSGSAQSINELTASIGMPEALAAAPIDRAPSAFPMTRSSQLSAPASAAISRKRAVGSPGKQDWFRQTRTCADVAACAAGPGVARLDRCGVRPSLTRALSDRGRKASVVGGSLAAGDRRPGRRRGLWAGLTAKRRGVKCW